MDDKLILALTERFSVSNIAELDLCDGAARLVLRKDAAFARGAELPPEHADAPGGSAAPAGGSAVHLGFGPGESGAHVRAETGTENAKAAGELITSPIVATFYAASGPGAPAFVKAGGRVKAGETLCILEAMKMMNHLEAEFDCEIISVKAASGDLVEYGQVLFEVKRL
ncbi:MAG: acetyl-CoA carboxylase biotin carboxyl carrier protein [Treponema sp.]|jgi:acetyl-CoA carboxylase biotin carboxyl carrier protein|nr:acetyl-CoA carboxylase biotin carboxyl carrier protein [Treponema sp.]